MDATYFKAFCVVCYQDDEDSYTQLIRFTDGEHFIEIKEDLENLIKLGVHIESVTTDGHKSALKAIKRHCLMLPFSAAWYISRECVCFG